MVLREALGRKRDEVTGELEQQLNEELLVLNSSPNILRVIR
jgi:hypothetical protein